MHKCYCIAVGGYQQCVSDCITQAAMLSPPVLHFVMLSLRSCSAYLLFSKFNPSF